MNATSNEFTMPVGPHHNILTEKIAVDCEMMQSNIGQVLGCVSVVNYESETIFDTFAQLAELFRDRIVIGHDIQKDLKVISMDLPSYIQLLQGVALRLTPITFNMTVRDTQKYSRYRQYANQGAHQGPSLKNLALEVLGRQIKQGRTSSVEDAIATMEFYRNTEVDIDREQGK